tara:strand:- start:2181 stop:2915 length:735 start_codon:yes stop_codon:yes gene_type:complete
MILIAHRGISCQRPENTFASFDYALKLGIPYIELDLHLSSDGVPVVMHDETVDRTTNGSGPISDFTKDELMQLDAGSWFMSEDGKQFSSETVPVFEDLLRKYSGQAHIFAEIKSKDPNLIPLVQNLIDKYGWLNTSQNRFGHVPGISIISFDRDQLLRSKKLMPDLGHGLLSETCSEEIIDFCKINGLQGIFPYIHAITPELMALITRKGLYTGAWGIQNKQDVNRARDMELDGITLDCPQEFS